MPTGLAKLAETAMGEMESRPCAPRVVIQKTESGWQFACPFAPEYADHWAALLFEAFGTRSVAVMNHFLSTIAKLLPHNHWDEERSEWFPDQDTFDAAVEIVHSIRPENAAQAAHAAQLVALHLSAMKLGEHAAQSYADHRTTAILNKTVRAFGEGLERVQRLQGKLQPRAINQTIQVVYVDNRDQRSVHLTGGPGQAGGQAHAAMERAALPSPCPHDAEAMPLAGCSRKEGLPDAWWGKRLWRTLWAG